MIDHILDAPLPQTIWAQSGYGYHDPNYEERAQMAGLNNRISALESAAKRATRPHTRDTIFNALCACHATIAAIVLSRP